MERNEKESTYSFVVRVTQSCKTVEQRANALAWAGKILEGVDKLLFIAYFQALPSADLAVWELRQRFMRGDS